VRKETVVATLEERVTALELRREYEVGLLERVLIQLKRLNALVCGGYSLDQEGPDPDEDFGGFGAFLIEHAELKTWRSRDGEVLFHADRWWWDSRRLLRALERALRRRPEGVTAREILYAVWGPDSDYRPDLAASVGSRLLGKSRRGEGVVRLPGKPCRWTLTSHA
jgi:hypothetical protein